MGATPQGSYYFSPATSGEQPYVYFAESASTQLGFDVCACLDNVFAGGAPHSLPSSGPFAFQAATTQACPPPLKYQLSASGGAGLWKFTAAPLRTDLCGAFDKLIAELDAAGLRPGRVQLMRSLMAQLLPLTFAETLYFRYGLDPATRRVDLTPEMRLRVDFQAHQAVDPGTSLLNGFVGSATAYVGIGERSGNPVGVPPTPADATLTFDRFLGSLAGLSVTASGGGGGGVIDLQGAAYQMPHWRLLYPATYPSSAATGFIGPQGNPTLVGAPTLAALDAATATYASNGTIAAPAVAAYFRGRATIVPEIPVFVQGERRYVALGTTIRDLLGGVSAMPRIQSAFVDIPTQTCWRIDNRLWVGGSSQVAWGVNKYSALTLATTAGGYQCYGDALDSLDLPVLGGDVLSLNLPGA